MNELGYDLGTIGNHEWDNGPDNLGRYWPKLNFPIVCANIDFTKNPELGKLVKPYHIFEDLGVAVIGYITNVSQLCSAFLLLLLQSMPTVAHTNGVADFVTCFIDYGRYLERWPLCLVHRPYPCCSKVRR